MLRRLRPDDSGVASTVATMLTLFVVLIFMEAAVISIAPQQQYTAEWVTSRQALQSLDLMRSAVSGPALAGSTFSVAIPIGTPATSPFTTASEGALSFSGATFGGPTLSLSFVPHFNAGQLTKVDQDVILVLDSSGSMRDNDPMGLRYFGAKQYIDSLTPPDRVVMIDFDSCSAMTRLVIVSCNSGTGLPTSTTGVAHHLYAIGHNGDPDYTEAKGDLDRFTCPGPGCGGGTNFGIALKLANDELVTYGDPNHAHVVILLTDGANCGGTTPCIWDTVALAEAGRAKANDITIYTIGLLGTGETNETILQAIADITDGTYYPAPTPEDIRWIYFEISRRFAGAFSCGTFVTADVAAGSVSLTLANTHYPRQTFQLEGGALSILQTRGASVYAGLPLEYSRTSNASGELAMTLLTFTGNPFSAVGTDYAILQAHVIARDVEDQVITKINLGAEANAVLNTSANVQYWADQGAATQAAAAAIRQPLEMANGTIRWADENVTTGQITPAKFNIDRAQSQLSAASQEVETQRALGQIQSWLAKQTQDEIAIIGCKLDQWINWYEGITIQIQSPAARAWAIWLNETFRNVGGGATVGVSGDVAVLSIHAIDRFILDRRIVELSLGR